MSERNKPHNGRDLGGHYRVRQEDVDEMMTDPKGPDFIRDDVRLGGAVADTGIEAGQRGAEIGKLIEDNEAAIEKLHEPPAAQQRHESRGKH